MQTVSTPKEVKDLVEKLQGSSSDVAFFCEFLRSQPQLTASDIRSVFQHLCLRVQQEANSAVPSSLFILCEGIFLRDVFKLSVLDELLELEDEKSKQHVFTAIRTFSGTLCLT